MLAVNTVSCVGGLFHIEKDPPPQPLSNYYQEKVLYTPAVFYSNNNL